MKAAFRAALLALATAAYAAPAAAALPPKYQRLAEMRAVLDHAGIQERLGERLVERVDYVRTDLYRVHAGRCSLDAAIVGLPMPSGMVGARRFEVRPGRLRCR